MAYERAMGAIQFAGKGRTDSIIPPTITSQPNWFFRTKNDLSSYVETRKPQAALILAATGGVETRKPQASAETREQSDR